MSQEAASESGIEIAIIGMAGRFPGAPDVETLWRNVRDKTVSLTELDDQALLAAGVPSQALTDPGYVRRVFMLGGLAEFDAEFFGYSPREAESIDPQQRVFLETAWQALEHAGYGGETAALTGVYASGGPSLYLLRHLAPSVDWRTGDIASLLGLLNGTDHDSLATRVAYELDLRGPAVAVQTACSSSATAVHLACRDLLNHDVDLALAGGVWLNLLENRGYRHQPGAILSPDGYCRAFDARAAGTAIGSGAGVVVLKRLTDALADGDTIHAVIKGSALNNDGAAKVGYTAPSLEQQAEVIRAALALAQVPADSIGYVEAHGTGTVLGDPIEIAALTQAFRASTRRERFCAIGSVKANVGHLDAAAGVTGLIKTVMALAQKTLPPSPSFEQPNPRIDFATSPFYVSTEAKHWPRTQGPRRAAVSSFGMGGTNVHLVLEEAPAAPYAEVSVAHARSASPQLLCLSARTPSALDASIGRLARHIEGTPEQMLADVAHTLRVGRRRFEHRAVALVRDHAEAVRILDRREPGALVTGSALGERPTVAFLFPGQGTQHVRMGWHLYEREPVFRRTLDACNELLAPSFGLDLREALHPQRLSDEELALRLEETAYAQPALFAVEYAMAQLWMSRGVQPDALLGHSVGEYVAACIAGVFSLQDALSMVVARGRLMQTTGAGAMLAVSLSQNAIESYLASGCDLAAVNVPDLCVLSGSVDAVARVERDLAGRGVFAKRLHVSRAFHSALMDPILEALRAAWSSISFKAPRIPFISNVSGTWIGAEECRSPDYWVRHARSTVRFADGVRELLTKPDRILLEVGPGDTLSGLARRQLQVGERRPVLASQCHPQRAESNGEQFVRAAAQLWTCGIEIDSAASPGERRRRVPLPTYPFERKRYWVEAPSATPAIAAAPNTGVRDMREWFYVPRWKRAESISKRRDGDSSGCVLVLSDTLGVGDRLRTHLQAFGRPVICVEPGDRFTRLGAQRYAVRPGEREDFERLLREIVGEAFAVEDICHLWSLDSDSTPASWRAFCDLGFYTLVALAQAIESVVRQKVMLTVVTNGLEDVTGTESLTAEKATLHGPCKVIPQEYPGIGCRLIDVVPPADDEAALERLVRQIAGEMHSADAESLIAFRGPHRSIRVFEPLRADLPQRPVLRTRGVYLITGGLGGIGLVLARHLAEAFQARLVLLGRNAPPREQWQAAALDENSSAARERMQALLAMEAAGAEVLTLAADVSDRRALDAALCAARARFGAINGVIHAAGVAGDGLIANITLAEAERVFAPKVQGTQLLMEALADQPLDFVLLCSSLVTLAGGLGRAAYASANAYLDAFASASRRESDVAVVAVNWDGWRDAGMAAGRQLPHEIGIAPDQGVQAFERILGLPAFSQIAVSTIDLASRLAIEPASVLEKLGDALVNEPHGALHRRTHRRPDITAQYVEPSGDLETGLATLWSEFLGLSPVGSNDNLFELGADSLLAIQLLAKVGGVYKVEVHPAAFFKAPTVASLAMLVERLLIDDIERAAAVES